ncbi:uncharacterized protein LOC114881663 [Osmia bicornis bicornis]|uniref:uncharacterized protein LOC114881663 n=1 Tax=Osmia bicornis bicornis TaxID=1437191 RepID=UPI001EAF62C3|nr:uncharacterized protein LOC114881663 [Osmia bicornis bicornis]
MQLVNCVASNQYDVLTLKRRLNRVTQILTEYEELHDELTIIDPDNDRLDELLEIQNRYYECAGKIEGLEVASTSAARANDTIGNVTGLNTTQIEGRRVMKLPVAELPKFHGDTDDWLSYKNTFTTMIDARTDLADLEKFLYLKSSLKGEALTKISLFSASEENYKNAWQMLVDTYEKRRTLVTKHMYAILDTKVLTKATPNGLSKLIDDVRQHLLMLKLLDVTPDNTVIISILERALPHDVREKWEESLNLDVLPTVDQFYKFINETVSRMRTLEQAGCREKAETQTGSKRRADRDSRATKTRKSESSARTLVTATPFACTYCKKAHSVYKCPAFEKLTTSQRWETVKSKGLCRNCLRSHAGPCKAPLCRQCKRFHNSLLHYTATQNSPAVPSTSQQKSENEATDSKVSL